MRPWRPAAAAAAPRHSHHSASADVHNDTHSFFLPPASRPRRYHEVQERMMRNASAALGRDRHKMTVIIDMAGIGLRHLSTATLSVLHKRTRLEEVRGVVRVCRAWARVCVRALAHPSASEHACAAHPRLAVCLPVPPTPTHSHHRNYHHPHPTPRPHPALAPPRTTSLRL